LGNGKIPVGGETRKMWVDMIKTHYTLPWKCHNETHYFVQLIYANIIEKSMKINKWRNKDMTHFKVYVLFIHSTILLVFSKWISNLFN
jgi:transposase-like protein